jgi:phosphoribosylformylglycinamidine synthase subunit PurSL
MPSYLVAVATSTAGEPFRQQLYLLGGSTLTPDTVQYVVETLLYDPVVQQAGWSALEALAVLPAMPADARVIEIAFKPGVTDNEAESLLGAARRFGIDSLEVVRTLRRYVLSPDASSTDYFNDLIEMAFEYPAGAEIEQRRAWYRHLLLQPVAVTPRIATVALREADDDELLRISRQGILALDLTEMQVIRSYFAQLGRDPRDGELETIAQTWSEHCSHKTFKARVRYRETIADHEPPAVASGEHYPMLGRLGQGVAEIDSLIGSFLMQATQQVLEQRRQAPADWVLSAFVDNAGIIAFNDDYEVSFKVETHNHPSALEPFGGANTGVGGVIRDVLGVSARPIANTNVLCFGDFAMAESERSPGVLHPQRICQGVVAGIRDYGNKLGIPTVNGAVLFDRGYTANPLVFCGTVGLAPRGRHPRQVQPGDAIVVLGGRTGRDGIHGATFSSAELTHSTAEEVGSAVQIGDPISEKKFMDVLLQARDRGMYHAITDCGAGGLSSAVGEMGAETGVAVELEHVPLKYAGLQPWEIWLSEAQERMVLAVPPDRLAEFLQLCAGEDVEATAIGQFNQSGRLLVQYQGATLVDIDMHFLHDGRPQRMLDAVWQGTVPPAATASPAKKFDHRAMLLRLLAHPSIASKERIVRTYDHEVGGMTVLKPLVGAQSDGPGDAAVLRPLANDEAALALGCGINPKYGEVDPYWMALACVDEALRNVVAVGGDPQRTAILDNFCWGDPRQPDRMAGLVRAAAGCYDAAVAFGTPFISGKDSLNNEYRDSNGQRVAIPPTLLISALAQVPDMRQCITMDLKQAGSYLYLVGATRDELLGSHYALLAGGAPAGSRLPQVDLSRAPARCVELHAAIRAGLVRACHDLSEGGLAVAAAEMAFAGELGLDLDLAAVALEGVVQTDDVTVRLFAETPSRWLVEVAAEHAAAFEARLRDQGARRIGQVVAESRLLIRAGRRSILEAAPGELKAAWQNGLEGSGL